MGCDPSPSKVSLNYCNCHFTCSLHLLAVLSCQRLRSLLGRLQCDSPDCTLLFLNWHLSEAARSVQHRIWYLPSLMRRALSMWFILTSIVASDPTHMALGCCPARLKLFASKKMPHSKASWKNPSWSQRLSFLCKFVVSPCIRYLVFMYHSQQVTAFEDVWWLGRRGCVC